MPADLPRRSSDVESPPTGPGGTRRRTALVLGLLAFLVYNANLRVIGSGDSIPARFLPFALLQHGTLYLDPVLDQARVDRELPGAYWIRPLANGHFASQYPVVTPLLVAPLYLPAVGWLALHEPSDLRLARVAYVMEKLAASAVAALGVAWLYLLLARRVSRPTSIAVTLAIAFGTTTWVTSSQALWQHGIGELAMVGALWFASTRDPSTIDALGCGLMCGILAANRPPDALLALPIGLLLMLRRPRQAWAVGLGGLGPVLAVLGYNLAAFQRIAGGYAAVLDAGFMSRSGRLEGIAGMLFSPTKGLFVFSPFLLAAPLALRRRPPEGRGLDLACAGAIALLVVGQSSADWRGGMSYGPRFLTDALPCFAWLLAPVVEAAGPALRRTLLVLVAIAVLFQAIGAVYYAGLSDLRIAGPPTAGYRAAWDPANFPPWVELHQPRPVLPILGILRRPSFRPRF